MKLTTKSVLFGAAACALLASAAYAAMKPSIRDLVVQPLDVQSTPIASFQKVDVGTKIFGKLTWRGGLVLSSPSEHFGGWSGLVVDAVGRKLLAVSDAGTWMSAEITYTDGMISGLKSAKLGPLKSLDQKNLRRDRDRDAEAIALVSGSLDNGELLISFEQNSRIGRFAATSDGISAPSSYINVPVSAKRMKRNSGFEAVTVVRGGPHKGAIIAISERLLSKNDFHTGWLWVKGEPKEFYLTDVGFDITDVATHEDGRMFVLERRFRWIEGVKMRIREIAAADLKPDAVLEGEVLIEAGFGSEIDNMEGLALSKGPRGETVLTILSDDNFNTSLQRTLLLQFALDDEANKNAGNAP